MAYPGDIANPDVAETSLNTTAKHFGRLDIVVVNAGVAQFHDFLSAPDSLIESHVSVNVKGAYFTVRAAGRILKAQGQGGSIIGISSVSALTGSKELVHYTPTKAAVLNLMQSSAVALGAYGIRCNSILPGTIRTQLNAEDLAKGNKAEQVASRAALGRVGVPQDVSIARSPSNFQSERTALTHVDCVVWQIAGPALFLASHLSNYMVGSEHTSTWAVLTKFD
ncbi:hypothetical protein ABEF95_014679 [Exophiala dermatitidis]